MLKCHAKKANKILVWEQSGELYKHVDVLCSRTSHNRWPLLGGSRAAAEEAGQAQRTWCMGICRQDRVGQDRVAG